jgi:hypothetical protein
VGFIAVCREGSFHGDHPFHGTLEAYRYAFGAGFERVMSIAEAAVPGALRVSRVTCGLKYRHMTM